MPRPHQLIHHKVKLPAIRLVRHHPKPVEVGAHHGGQHVMSAHHAVRHLNTLGGCQAAADHFLQRPLQGGIARVAQLVGKADHRGFTDA
ncbi:hypothetical protein SDC9_118761 [bioreactor metagenome]|uniref:Uncharacterized protein n=1 Tax=bioreactor metagenome TaxID=1076179 RepID=A0A645C201_9ZZZZ